MTPEEQKELDDLKAQISDVNKTVATLTTQVSDLTAERDSYKDENQKLKEKSEAQAKELQETKKLNFALARRTSAEEPKTFEETLAEAMVIKKGK